MEVGEWQQRLIDNFSHDGTVGANLHPVIDAENAYGYHFVSTYHGQNYLIESFQSFFFESLERARSKVYENGWPDDQPNYAPVLIYFVTMFRSYRACENLFLKGYPYDGYALLRDLKDRAIFLSAIAQGITNFQAIMGYPDKDAEITDDAMKRLLSDKKKEEIRVLNLMIRGGSGLPPEVIEELGKWEQLFNAEVHGSRMSYFDELGPLIKGEREFTVSPVIEEMSMAMYMNRSAEIGWLITKLLPYLQLQEGSFGDQWLARHAILDESFRYMQNGLSKLGKQIGDAFTIFVDEKFSFSNEFHYQE